jgi:DNA-binding NtrC family response regulator
MTAEMLGHRVVAEAGTISAAKPLARNAEFDMAVLDINVGGTNIAPIAQISADRGLPFIFVSGYGASGLPQSFQERPALRKPFLIEGLAEMIEKALGDRPTLRISRLKMQTVQQPPRQLVATRRTSKRGC